MPVFSEVMYIFCFIAPHQRFLGLLVLRKNAISMRRHTSSLRGIKFFECVIFWHAHILWYLGGRSPVNTWLCSPCCDISGDIYPAFTPYQTDSIAFYARAFLYHTILLSREAIGNELVSVTQACYYVLCLFGPFSPNTQSRLEWDLLQLRAIIKIFVFEEASTAFRLAQWKQWSLPANGLNISFGDCGE